MLGDKLGSLVHTVPADADLPSWYISRISEIGCHPALPSGPAWDRRGGVAERGLSPLIRA
jgi:hypothetical protein